MHGGRVRVVHGFINRRQYPKRGILGLRLRLHPTLDVDLLSLVMALKHISMNRAPFSLHCSDEAYCDI